MVSRYPDHLNDLNTKGIEMPMATKDITKFEKTNPKYIINVYSCNPDGSNIQPRRISKIRDKSKKIVNLLMLCQDEKYHYVLITNLNSLLGKRGDPRLFCPYCCHGFTTRFGYNQEKLEQHMEECFQYKGCRVILPEVEKSIVEFKQTEKQLMAPYVIYADCGAIIKNLNDNDIHEISGFTIAVVSPYEKTETITFRGWMLVKFL